MAKNKFASMLHTNTNKITMVLIYAVVEWILMLLLLFNSVISFFIIKYAEFFGVERPCPWCTVNMHTDLVCQAHANHISQLRYCSNHRNLGLARDMCSHCIQSNNCSTFSWRMKEFGVIQNQKEKVGGSESENGEPSLKCCCCCGVRLDHCNTTMLSSCMLLQKLNYGQLEEIEAEDGILQMEEKFENFTKKSPQKLQFVLHYDDHGRVEDEGVSNNRSIFDQMEVILDFDINVEHNSLVFGVNEFQEDDRTAFEEVAQIDTDENEADVSIGTEIPDIEHEVEDQESNLDEADDRDLVLVKKKMVQFKHTLKMRPPFQLELNEIEDDGVPNTPASADSLNRFHINSMFLEKKDFGSEESTDGSVTSELESDGGVVTIESLKSALRAERKTLQVLYYELEEERSASAEAANQAMAMINRLQQEKAAMQMEAFQYERMMEEQSDYDQEALQLINDLMVKKDKEKQDLEEELQLYKKKALHYEKMRVFHNSSASSKSGISSDSDGVSIEGEGNYVVNLEADFEEERVSILAELKVLEAKLMLLDGEYEEFPLENGHGIEAEVDQRLEGFEADADFIKHCVRKGDRIQLLHDILQHLRHFSCMMSFLRQC